MKTTRIVINDIGIKILPVDDGVQITITPHARTHADKTLVSGGKPPSPPSGGGRGVSPVVGSSMGLFKDEEDNPPTPWNLRCANRLFKMLMKRRKIMNRHTNVTAWAKYFTRLHRQGYTKKRINTTLAWYCLHFGDDFVPDARSARTFADKFDRIEAAMERAIKENKTTDVKTVYVDDEDDSDSPIVSEGCFDMKNLNGNDFIGG